MFLFFRTQKYGFPLRTTADIIEVREKVEKDNEQDSQKVYYSFTDVNQG